MEEKEAKQIAGELLKLLRNGNDARAQIDFLCNKLRIKKKVASELQQIFQTGVRAGSSSVMNGTGDSPPAENDHPLYIAAFHLGRGDFQNAINEQARKNRSGGCGALFALSLAALAALVIIVARLT